eukprot:CAMPEP_0181351842 /NCGR_PEP_ID=MMETSP1106-20121128/1998_1 /TAXON_ID=81844 /ORGANISM="Mantoniella antarctica, Strain SL-175" /LENGTH=357 /DNA_ID=CAMNT_0023464375 /DNA_START=43 /DNA_END=1112 /DNA_ORIENTATION=-
MTTAQALRATTTVRPLEVEAAFYGNGLMLLCDATERDDDARLFMAARDLTLPPHLQVAPHLVNAPGQLRGGYGGGQLMGGYGGGAVNRSLREVVTPQQLVGRAASSVGAVAEVPLPAPVMRDLDPPYPAGAPAALAQAPRPLRSELATQHVAPRRRFVIVTNAGVVQLEKARPLDALCKLLAGEVHEQLAHFFKSYGQAEAATMCLALAVGSSDAKAGRDVAESGAGPIGGGGAFSSANGIGSGPNFGARGTNFGVGVGDGGGSFGGAPAGLDGGYVHGYTANLAERARRALEDTRLTGEPHVEDDADGAGGLGVNGGSAGAGGHQQQPFDMGRPVVQPLLRYSGVHRGLYTYAARL